MFVDLSCSLWICTAVDMHSTCTPLTEEDRLWPSPSDPLTPFHPLQGFSSGISLLEQPWEKLWLLLVVLYRDRGLGACCKKLWGKEGPMLCISSQCGRASTAQIRKSIWGVRCKVSWPEWGVLQAKSCTDYWGLTAIMVQYPYLCLVFAIFYRHFIKKLYWKNYTAKELCKHMFLIYGLLEDIQYSSTRDTVHGKCMESLLRLIWY